jgi:hypothetical protein
MVSFMHVLPFRKTRARCLTAFKIASHLKVKEMVRIVTHFFRGHSSYRILGGDGDAVRAVDVLFPLL